MLIRFVLCCAFFSATAAMANPSTIKAKVEEPVVEEVMGGCSLKCAFDWAAQIFVPGGRTENTRKLNDDSALTAWLAEDPKDRSGSETPDPPSEGAQNRRNRNSSLRSRSCEWLLEGGGPLAEVRQGKARAPLLQRQAIPRPSPLSIHAAGSASPSPTSLCSPGDTLTFEVLEVFPGKGAGLAISEVVLQGAH
jgi:hypothetical protein